MKRSKFIPGILLLILCVGVLAVGIYAAEPTNNKISGTIRVSAADAQVEITAYLESIDPNNIASKTFITRTGGEFTIDKELKFELADVKDEEGLATLGKKTIVLQIKNNSSKQLGVFFSEGNSIVTTKKIQHKSKDIATMTFDGYKELPGNSTISTNLVITIDSINVESLNTNFYFELSIEDI